MKKQPKTKQHQGTISVATGKRRPPAAFGVVAALIVGSSIAAYATNDLLHGHVAKDERATPSAPNAVVDQRAVVSSASKTPAPSASPAELVNRYGSLADSLKVAAEIKKAEGSDAAIAADRRTLAQRKAEAYEKLEHGVIDPANPPPQFEIIRHGLVPPGMSQQQAAMLYSSLPGNLRAPYTPRPGSPEWLARATGEPGDPMPVLPDGITPAQIRAANDAQLEVYIRSRSGPGGIVPLHVDHNWLAEHARRTNTGFVADHQISLIAPEYGFDTGSVREMTDSSGNIVYQQSFDPYGNAVKLQGSGPTPDFGYDGYYVHQRSGLDLTLTRAYSPVLGRFLNRDPIQERGGINLYAYCKNDPINSIDPTGLWQWYGNWGGPDWGNGRQQNEVTGNWPREGEPGFVPPINCRDRCYYNHDVCLNDAGRHRDAAWRQTARRDCDWALAACLRGVPPGFNRFPGELAGEIGLFGGQNPPNNNPGTYSGLPDPRQPQ